MPRHREFKSCKIWASTLENVEKIGEIKQKQNGWWHNWSKRVEIIDEAVKEKLERMKKLDKKSSSKK